MKICTKCGGNGPFPRDKKHKDGLASWCRLCYREYNHNYHAQNREREVERIRQYHQTHHKEDREYIHKWNMLHPEKSKEIAKKSRKKNSIQRLDAKRFRRALKYGVSGNFTNNQWENLKAEYGFRCAYCNIKADKLEPDHVISLSRGGSNDISNIVPACKSCNSSKQDKPLLIWMYIRTN